MPRRPFPGHGAASVFPFFRTTFPGMPRSRRTAPPGTARGPDYISRQASRPEEYITHGAARRLSAQAPLRAGLLLPDGWLRRLLAMESYDVIANQPVVIDNVSAGGRASREGGKDRRAAIPFVIGSGRASPAPPHPPPSPAGLGRRLRPSYGAVRCVLAGRRWGGAVAVRRVAIG